MICFRTMFAGFIIVQRLGTSKPLRQFGVSNENNPQTGL